LRSRVRIRVCFSGDKVLDEDSDPPDDPSRAATHTASVPSQSSSNGLPCGSIARTPHAGPAGAPCRRRRAPKDSPPPHSAVSSRGPQQLGVHEHVQRVLVLGHVDHDDPFMYGRPGSLARPMPGAEYIVSGHVGNQAGAAADPNAVTGRATRFSRGVRVVRLSRAGSRQVSNLEYRGRKPSFHRFRAGVGRYLRLITSGREADIRPDPLRYQGVWADNFKGPSPHRGLQHDELSGFRALQPLAVPSSGWYGTGAPCSHG